MYSTTAALIAALAAGVACGADAPAAGSSTTGAEGSSDATTGSTSSTDTSSGTDTSSESGSSSTGDDDPFADDPPDGDPLPPADPFVWQWIEIEGSTCRDGSPAGFEYRYGTADALMIFFEGGGACFNGGSCLFNPASIELPRPAHQRGVFADVAENPVRDWHVVFIPYCTGDIHVGARPQGTDDFPAGEGQRFVGWQNLGLFLARIHPTFADVDRLLLTGGSAGGFGSGCNFERFAKRFEIADAIMIDDSGPPMADEFMSACLQEHWRTSWGLTDTFLASCDECNDQPDGGGIVDIVPYLSEALPEATMGFVSSIGDYNIRQFYGYGTNDCADLFAIAPPDYPPETYAAGLFDLRDRFATGPGWGTFFFEGTSHTVLHFDEFYALESGGVTLRDWFASMIERQPSHVEP